ncbi:calcium-binding protein [Massilia pseudoviolaceinigra]|uniref:calcium-binding protein n=1 Tax=Massilia pseudoviolaceinigra TaxID=3057165 RepID=UPI0027965FD6|nr:calcium-binding protein [Massilia sp. CCM 9206]MDQ1924709.1 calcium-binding protein [Massilia sp. CCM 9206]
MTISSTAALARSTFALAHRSAAGIGQDAGATAALAGPPDTATPTSGLTLTGSAGMDTLAGGALDDRIYGLGDTDHLFGEASNDYLDGGAGSDVLSGGDGDDMLVGGEGNDILTGGYGSDTLSGGNGNDQLTVRDGDTVLDGGAGDDTLDGGYSEAQMNGGNGNDYLKIVAAGYSGLFGGNGRDVLDMYMWGGRVVASGGADDDTIILRRDMGASTVVNASGGTGVDTYEMQGAGRTGSVIVKDFSAGAGGDRIDVKALFTASMPGADPLAAGIVRFLQSGTSTLVEFDRDGTAGADTAYTLLTLQNVAASTLTADNLIYAKAPAAPAMAPVQLVGLAPHAVGDIHAG